MTELEDLKSKAYNIRSKIFALLVCKNLFFYGSFAAFIAGLYFLVTNVLAFKNELPGIILSISLLGLTLAVSSLMAARRLPSQKKIIVLLDRLNQCGGMLLSSAELSEAGWRSNIGLEELPSLKLRSSKMMIIFAATLVFAIASYLAPPAVTAAVTSTHMDIKNQTGTLAEQLQVMEEEKIITQKEAMNMREQISKLEKNAAGEDPVKTWEALDHIKDSLSFKAEEFADKAARNAKALELSQKALEALKEARKRAGTAEYGQAKKEMAELMRKLAGKCPELSSKLSKELKDMLSDGKLSEEAMEKLLNSQQLTQKQLERLMKKLKECGLCKKSGCKSGESGEAMVITRENFEELMKMLDEASQNNSGGCKAKTCMMLLCAGDLPGQGGINRGRGDAPMSWSNKALDSKDAKFKAVTLPGNALQNMKKSKLVGVSYGEAKVNPDGKISTGHLGEIKVKGTRTNRYVLMPRHRTMVKKYFSKTNHNNK